MISGVLDYALLAQKHRPCDNEAMSAEVRRLASTGLKAIDIAVALRLSLELVSEWLGAPLQ